METIKKRHRVVVDDSVLAARIGGRIKEARARSGLTQAELAGERYTKAYISALEHGLAKPSMAALNYLAPRLGSTPSRLISDEEPGWRRLEADIALASGDWLSALDHYQALATETADMYGHAEIQTSTAECLCRLNRAREAIGPATEAVDAFRDLARPRDVARAAYWLASAHFQADNLDAARPIVTSLIAQVRDGLRIAPDFQLRLLVGAALIESAGGAPATALAYLEEARALSVDLDDRRRGAYLGTLAVACREAGDMEGAIASGRGAIALMRAADADTSVLALENDLALAYLANGNLVRAADLAHDARLAALARHDGFLAAHLAGTEAQIALAGGDPEASVAMAVEALDLAQDATNERATLDALVTRAQASAALGLHADAAADFERAAGLAADYSRPVRRREILSAWADCLAAMGRHDRAFALAREALDQR